MCPPRARAGRLHRPTSSWRPGHRLRRDGSALGMSRQRPRQRGRGGRVEGAAAHATADLHDAQVDARAAAAAHRRLAVARGSVLVLHDVQVAHRVSHPRGVERLFGAVVVAVRELAGCVECETRMPVAREEPHLFAGQERRRVQQIAERQRTRAALESEVQRDHHGDGLRLVLHANRAPERHAVADVQFVTCLTRFQSGTALERGQRAWHVRVRGVRGISRGWWVVMRGVGHGVSPCGRVGA